MGSYLPHLHDLLDLGITWVIAASLLLAGVGICGRRVPPEAQLVAGWGALCVLATLWGVLLPISMRIALVLFVTGSAGVMAFPSRRPSREAWAAMGRLAVVSVPFWLVMAPIRPAEPDTWLNLLPNAVYLVDYGMLPTASRPLSFSFLPAAPYDTQFLSFFGGLIDPSYPAAGMSLTNLLLLLVGGLLIARIASGPDSRAGWSAGGFGLLLATLFNPGFVPRVHLAAYGETGLAVTALVAAWMFVAAQRARVKGRDDGNTLLAAALALAAMVNVKQSGFGLVAAVSGAAAVLALAERRMVAVSLRAVGYAILPAMVLYLVWRGFVATAGVDELKPLPFGQWQWGNIPAMLGSVAHVVANKGLYFGCVAAAIAAFPVLYRRVGWTDTTRLLLLHASLFLFYSLFILLTYIGHFPGPWSTEAHSFFRYETHLSLVLVLALVLAGRDLGMEAWLTGQRLKVAGVTVLVVALLAPIGFARLLRFDLDQPQPLVWDLAKNLVPYLKDGDRLALLLPGDNGSVATMLAGVLADTAPRVRNLDLLRRNRADAATLDATAAAGYDLAFISCTPDSLSGVPSRHAALMTRVDGMWRPQAIWAYPEDAARRRWQHVLSWQPLCRNE